MDTSRLLAEYAKNPPNKYEMEDATVVYTERNRMCSETLQVFLRIGSKEIVQDFSFLGDMATFTTGVTSLFGESIVGLDVQVVLDMDISYIKELLECSEIAPNRKYASLFALLATKNAIHTYKQDGIEEDFSDILEK